MATSRGYNSKYYTTFATLRKNGWRSMTGSALLSLNVLKVFENPDKIDKASSPTAQSWVTDVETGEDRLRKMFSYDEFGDPSPELQTVTQSGIMGFFTGSVIGGTIHSRENYMKFMERNQASAFYSHLDAKKRLQDKVMTGFFRGAWMWGWRLGLFTLSITFFTTTFSVYRGKSSLLEYITGGALAGSLYKFKQGPKPMISGCIIGGGLGTIAGCVSLGVLYLTGTSMEEVRYWQYKWKEEKQDATLQKFREKRQRDMNILMVTHEENATSEFLKEENKSCNGTTQNSNNIPKLTGD
ncbi:Complex I assembly factor timmdc1, mitochondrial [Halocaridina rubra]|uniref:Complex I assembly factor TIMMDC1, mitochondrial n=1 Tax=Halocaridina rubra TaxID=373956 RepID=A0AAN8X0D1_HALRR